MTNAPRWLWTLIAGLLVGAGGTGAIALKILPFKNSTPNTVRTSDLIEAPDPLKNLVVIVKDSETKQTLDNADIEITYEKGIIPGKTLDDGTYRLQIPPQNLGAVTIIVRKKGYQQKEIPKDFAVNPNAPLTIYLNPDIISESSKTPDKDSSSSSINTQGKPTTTLPIDPIEWNDSAKSLRINSNLDQYFSYVCPSSGSIETIYGTNIYTSGSSICTAAVHSGLINARDGGQITILIQGVQDSYKGTKNNGIESRSYGKYGQSFIFIK